MKNVLVIVIVASILLATAITLTALYCTNIILPRYSCKGQGVCQKDKKGYYSSKKTCRNVCRYDHRFFLQGNDIVFAGGSNPSALLVNMGTLNVPVDKINSIMVHASLDARVGPTGFFWVTFLVVPSSFLEAVVATAGSTNPNTDNSNKPNEETHRPVGPQKITTRGNLAYLSVEQLATIMKNNSTMAGYSWSDDFGKNPIGYTYHDDNDSWTTNDETPPEHVTVVVGATTANFHVTVERPKEPNTTLLMLVARSTNDTMAFTDMKSDFLITYA